MTAPDVSQHREWLTSQVDVSGRGLIVDLGCGRGEDLVQLAKRAGSATQFEGIDRSAKSIEAAQNAAADNANVQFRVSESADTLPWADGSVDVVFSNNLLECIVDKGRWLQEVFRILRPGGQVVCSHWDWDSQMYEGTDKALVRKMVHAFADWKQNWMDASDGWMGRRLWGVFEGSGMFRGTVLTRVMTNTIFAEPWYGYARAQDFGSMVKRGFVTADEYDQFLGDIKKAVSDGRYFYAITGFLYVGRRAA